MSWPVNTIIAPADPTDEVVHYRILAVYTNASGTWYVGQVTYCPANPASVGKQEPVESPQRYKKIF